MAKKSETIFKEKVAKALLTIPNCFFVKIQQVTLRGTPDFFICISGKFIALELKRSRLAKVAPLQQFTLEKIANSGGAALITYPENWNETFKFLKAMAHQDGEEISEPILVEVH